ncbi:TetR/AcrR family transcriptional regulator [Thermodesulfovibrio sp. 3907-1M]|uniref:TetR/AcrR family transcriptional regulator n=1 Tax=Thermodesulfovibrio autotrophicus TaxID=3118333 RepID=UPI00338E1B3F
MNRRSGHESRKRIVDAAVKLFSQSGFNGTTMRMIAKEAGISVGGLYLYFKNKEELSLHLIKEKLNEFYSKVLLPLKEIQSPSQALKEYFTKALEFAKENRELIIIHAKQQGFTFGIEVKREFFKKEREILKEIISRGIESHEFNKCEPEEVAKLLMNIIGGYVLSVVVEPENLFKPEVCIDVLLKGLLKRSNL